MYIDHRSTSSTLDNYCLRIYYFGLVLLIITAYGFITLDDFQEAILALLIAKNQTALP